jgi:hypothetical protein
MGRISVTGMNWVRQLIREILSTTPLLWTVIVDERVPVGLTHHAAAERLRTLSAPARETILLAWRASCDWLTGRRWQDNEQGISAIEEVIVLEGMLVGIGGALLLYIQTEKLPQPRVLITYLAGSLLPLLGMLLIYTIRRSFADRSSAFNRGTLMFTRCVGIFSAVAVALFALAYAKSGLPGQLRDVPLPVAQAEVSEFKRARPDLGIAEGEANVVAIVFFCPSTHDFLKMPATLTIDAELNETARRSWQIASGVGKRLDGGDEPEIVTYAEKPVGPTKRFSWRDLRSEGAYMLEVRLRAINGDVPRDQLIRSIKEDPYGVLKVTTYYREPERQ